MNDLPIELIENILNFLPLYFLKSKCRLVSRSWNHVAHQVMDKRIKGCFTLLNNIGSMKPIGDIPDLFDIQELGLGGSKSEEYNKSPFKSWILCNLDYPSDSNVITGIEIMLYGYDSNTAKLLFKPTGMATFGIWVEHVGFFPITSPYALFEIAWLPKVDPLFRIWTHADEKIYPNAHLFLNQSNNTSNLAKNKTVPERRLGSYDLHLHDEFGIAGHINYTITSETLEVVEHSNLPPSLSGENLMLLQFEQEENKIVSSINMIVLNPQVILAIPL